MKKLILVRHGECDGNIDGRFRGRADFPLNDRGHQQASETAQVIKLFHPTAIYSSPLLRASQTASYLGSACDLPVIIHPEFNNLSLGVWEGKHKDDIQREYPELWAIWKKDPEELKAEGFETLQGLQYRTLKAVKLLQEKHPNDETIVVVTHRAVLKPLIAGLLGISSPYFWKLHVDNAAFCTFEPFTDYWMMLGFNANSHLSHFHDERL